MGFLEVFTVRLTEKLIFLLIIFLGSLLRFYFVLLHPVNSDAAWHLSIAENIALLAHIPQSDTFRHLPAFWPPPLFHLIAAQLYLIAADFLIMKFLSPVFGVMTLFISFLFFRYLFGTDVALLATFFLAVFPLHLYLSIISYVGTAVTFFTFFCTYFFLRAILEDNHKMMVMAGINFGLSLLTKATGFAVFFILIIISGIYYNKKKFKLSTLIWTILIGVSIGLVWYLRTYIIYGNPFGPDGFIFGSSTSQQSILDSIITNKSYLVFFNQTHQLLASFWVLNRNSTVISFITPVILTLTLLYGLREIGRRRYKADGVVITIVIVFTATTAIYLLDTLEIHGVRLSLPMIPALSGIIAFGFSKLFFGGKTDNYSSWRYPLIVFLVTLISASSTYTLYQKTYTVASDIETVSNACIWINNYTPDSEKILNDGWRDDVEFSSKRYTIYSDKNADLSQILHKIQKYDITYLLLQESFGLKEGTIELIDASTKFNKLYDSDFSIHIYLVNPAEITDQA
jgi:4-amino-4-deoxy-L-arabinose transferase-like glycosyltransferase